MKTNRVNLGWRRMRATQPLVQISATSSEWIDPNREAANPETRRRSADVARFTLTAAQ